jgi:cephalosporin-C deacetylase-like acetyl esterase
MKCFNVSYILIILFLTSQAKAYGQKDIIKDKHQGPEWVKQSLVNDGVLSAPEYTLTKEYDQYKQFDNIQGLFFEGLSYKGKSTKVFCWYGVPKTLKEDEKTPAVVLVHGGGGTAFPQWVKNWNDKGYIAISIALEGQIPGAKIANSKGTEDYQSLPNSGPARIGFFNDVTDDNLQDQWFYHAVADVILANSLLKSFPEVDSNNIGITGISWGGIITNVVTGIDDRFKFAIPVYGCGFLQETPLYKRLLGYLNNEAQAFYLNNWEPSLYVPLQKLPTLFVNGTNDKHFTMNSFTKTYEASSNEKYLRIEHNMVHGHGPGWNPKEIYRFADYCITKTEKPVVIQFEQSNKKNQLTYSYEGTVKEAFLYYTTDTSDWGEKNYEWIKAAAMVSKEQHTIQANIPENAVAYFVNTINVDGLLISSAMRYTK